MLEVVVVDCCEICLGFETSEIDCTLARKGVSSLKKKRTRSQFWRNVVVTLLLRSVVSGAGEYMCSSGTETLKMLCWSLDTGRVLEEVRIEMHVDRREWR